ncbi:MAG: hypothetical protein R3A52_15625 [Polyangiales bacterium]
MSRPRLYGALTACLPLLLMGCNHAMVGNVMALVMAAGLFFGTLSLGRSAPRGGAVEGQRTPPGLQG